MALVGTGGGKDIRMLCVVECLRTNSPTHSANTDACSTPDLVPGTLVMETNHLCLFGSSGLVGEAVKEESNGPKREGQLTGWGNSEDGGVRGSGRLYR